MAGTDDIIGGWIRSAERTGAVKNLPGYGKPLNLEDDQNIPRRYRMAYRILKNAGYTPPEVQMIQEIAELKKQLEQEQDKVQRELIEAQIRDRRQRLDVALDKFRAPR